MSDKNYTIQAIPTAYKSIQYKSRLEARTAIFFNYLGLNFEYEPKFFEIEKDFWYVPDFYLRDLELWVEIKGPGLYEEAYLKAKGLCKLTGQFVQVWCGNLGYNVVYSFCPNSGCNRIEKSLVLDKKFIDKFGRQRLNEALRIAIYYKFE